MIEGVSVKIPSVDGLLTLANFTDPKKRSLYQEGIVLEDSVDISYTQFDPEFLRREQSKIWGGWIVSKIILQSPDHYYPGFVIGRIRDKLNRQLDPEIKASKMRGNNVMTIDHEPNLRTFVKFADRKLPLDRRVNFYHPLNDEIILHTGVHDFRNPNMFKHQIASTSKVYSALINALSKQAGIVLPNQEITWQGQIPDVKSPRIPLPREKVWVVLH